MIISLCQEWRKEHRIPAIYRRKSRMRAASDVNKSCDKSGRALFIAKKTQHKNESFKAHKCKSHLWTGEINEMCTIV